MPVPAPPGGTTRAVPSVAVSGCCWTRAAISTLCIPAPLRGPSPTCTLSMPSFHPISPPQLRMHPQKRCTKPQQRHGAAEQ